MELYHLIRKIETKQEELKMVLLSNGFNFNNQNVQQLSKELDDLILQYLENRIKK